MTKKTTPSSARFRVDQYLRLTWRHWSAQFRQSAAIPAGALVAVVEISRHADGECHYHVRSEDGREAWADEESLELPLIPEEES